MKREESVELAWRRYLVGLRNRLGRPELSLLVLIVLMTAGIWAFAAIAGEVVEGDTKALDQTVLLAMRNPDDLSDPVGPRWVEEMGRDFTALGGVAVLTMITLIVIGYLLLRRSNRAALFVFAAVSGGQLLSFLMKAGFDRPRPDLVPHGSIVYTASFPSGHSMMAAVTYLTLGALLARTHKGRKMKAFFLVVPLLVTLLVGVSRVYMGVHWPTDVLAGWMAGAVWALLCWMLALWLQQRGSVETAVDEGDSE